VTRTSTSPRVILRRENEALWLDPELSNPELVLPLLRPYDAEAMHAYAVLSLVNSVANDSADLIIPRTDRPDQPASPTAARSPGAGKRQGQLVLPLMDELLVQPG
jgi:hypothetical protein